MASWVCAWFASRWGRQSIFPKSLIDWASASVILQNIVLPAARTDADVVNARVAPWGDARGALFSYSLNSPRAFMVTL